MIDYEAKAQKYKLKYLNLKKKYILIGGVINSEKVQILLKEGFTIEQIKLLQEIESSGIELTDEQIYSYTGRVMIKKVLNWGLPTTNLRLSTIPNTGGDTQSNSRAGRPFHDQCFYISLVDILNRTQIAPGITVEDVRAIGGLTALPDNQMWDSNEERYRVALTRICTYFNIEVRILSSTYGIDKRVRGEQSEQYEIPIGDYPYQPDHVIPGAAQPLTVYIAHIGIHFEAVENIRDSSGRLMYNLIPRPNRTIDLTATRMEVQQILDREVASRSNWSRSTSFSKLDNDSSNYNKAIKDSLRSVELDEQERINYDKAVKDSLKIKENHTIKNSSQVFKNYYKHLTSGQELSKKEHILHTLFELINDVDTRVHENIRKIKEQELNLQLTHLSKSDLKIITSASEIIIKELQSEIDEIQKLKKIYIDEINKMV